MWKKIVGILIVGFFISTSVFPSISGNMNKSDQLDQSQTYFDKWVNIKGNDNPGDGIFFYVFQGFVPTLPVLTRIEFYGCKIGDIQSDLIVSIVKYPIGPDLTSISIPSSSITYSPGAWINANFPDINVVPGEIYWIYLWTMGGDDQNKYGWGIKEANLYPSGYPMIYYNFEGGSLDPAFNCDSCFKTYGYNYGPSIDIIYPKNGDTVDGTISIKGTVFDPNGIGDVEWVMIKIDNNDWIEIDYSSTGNWTYIWDSTLVEDGSHFVYVISSDGTFQSGVVTNEFFVKNKEEDDLVGYWNFNEGSGDIVYDSSNYHNDGIINDAVWVVGGIGFGYALKFDGDKDYVKIPHSDSLIFDDKKEFSISVWYKTEKIENKFKSIIYKGLWEQNYCEYGIELSDTLFEDTLFTQLCFNIGEGHNTYGVCCSPGINTGGWHHICSVWDDGSMKLYFDGNLEISSEHENVEITYNKTDLYIGNVNHTYETDPCVNGLIDEVRIYNRALSDSEVQELSFNQVSETFDDYDDDVISYYWDENNVIMSAKRTDFKPNINIINASYSKFDRNVTITLEVEGKIEDRGDVITGNYVGYQFEILSSEREYDITYVNKTCKLFYDNTWVILDSYIIDDSILSINFALSNSSETIGFIEIITNDLYLDHDKWITQDCIDAVTNIDYSMEIKITRPTDKLYLFNKEILPLFSPVIIGEIYVECEELLNATKVVYTELYVSDELTAFSGFNNALIWHKLSFGKQKLKVLAFDFYGDRVSDEIEVVKFF